MEEVFEKEDTEFKREGGEKKRLGKAVKRKKVDKGIGERTDGLKDSVKTDELCGIEGCGMPARGRTYLYSVGSYMTGEMRTCGSKECNEEAESMEMHAERIYNEPMEDHAEESLDLSESDESFSEEEVEEIEIEESERREREPRRRKLRLTISQEEETEKGIPSNWLIENQRGRLEREVFERDLKEMLKTDSYYKVDYVLRSGNKDHFVSVEVGSSRVLKSSTDILSTDGIITLEESDLKEKIQGLHILFDSNGGTVREMFGRLDELIHNYEPDVWAWPEAVWSHEFSRFVVEEPIEMEKPVVRYCRANLSLKESVMDEGEVNSTPPPFFIKRNWHAGSEAGYEYFVKHFKTDKWKSFKKGGIKYKRWLRFKEFCRKFKNGDHEPGALCETIAEKVIFGERTKKQKLMVSKSNLKDIAELIEKGHDLESPRDFKKETGVMRVDEYIEKNSPVVLGKGWRETGVYITKRATERRLNCVIIFKNGEALLVSDVEADYYLTDMPESSGQKNFLVNCCFLRESSESDWKPRLQAPEDDFHRLWIGYRENSKKLLATIDLLRGETMFGSRGKEIEKLLETEDDRAAVKWLSERGEMFDPRRIEKNRSGKSDLETILRKFKGGSHPFSCYAHEFMGETGKYVEKCMEYETERPMINDLMEGIGRENCRMLFTDLDGTMVDKSCSERDEEEMLRNFNKMWNGMECSLICYNTARGKGGLNVLFGKTQLWVPDVVISSSGTEIRLNKRKVPREMMELDVEWEKMVRKQWTSSDLDGLEKLVRKYDESLSYPYFPPKCENGEARVVLTVSSMRKAEEFRKEVFNIDGELKTLINKEPRQSKEIFYVTVLPRMAGKINAAMYVRKKLGIKKENCIFAGDSMEDRGMFKTGCGTLMVGNAETKLVEIATKEKSRSSGADHVYALRHFSAGLKEGLECAWKKSGADIKKLMKSTLIEDREDRRIFWPSMLQGIMSSEGIRSKVWCPNCTNDRERQFENSGGGEFRCKRCGIYASKKFFWQGLESLLRLPKGQKEKLELLKNHVKNGELLEGKVVAMQRNRGTGVVDIDLPGGVVRASFMRTEANKDEEVIMVGDELNFDEAAGIVDGLTGMSRGLPRVWGLRAKRKRRRAHKRSIWMGMDASLPIELIKRELKNMVVMMDDMDGEIEEEVAEGMRRLELKMGQLESFMRKNKAKRKISLGKKNLVVKDRDEDGECGNGLGRERFESTRARLRAGEKLHEMLMAALRVQELLCPVDQKKLGFDIAVSILLSVEGERGEEFFVGKTFYEQTIFLPEEKLNKVEEEILCRLWTGSGGETELSLDLVRSDAKAKKQSMSLYDMMVGVGIRALERGLGCKKGQLKGLKEMGPHKVFDIGMIEEKIGRSVEKRVSIVIGIKLEEGKNLCWGGKRMEWVEVKRLMGSFKKREFELMKLEEMMKLANRKKTGEFMEKLLDYLSRSVD
jgi:HAD superfamily hydrolase (TIGR01484 family)